MTRTPEKTLENHGRSCTLRAMRKPLNTEEKKRQ